jgi:hypothetical protein
MHECARTTLRDAYKEIVGQTRMLEIVNYACEYGSKGGNWTGQALYGPSHQQHVHESCHVSAVGRIMVRIVP